MASTDSTFKQFIKRHPNLSRKTLSLVAGFPLIFSAACSTMVENHIPGGPTDLEKLRGMPLPTVVTALRCAVSEGRDDIIDERARLTTRREKFVDALTLTNPDKNKIFAVWEEEAKEKLENDLRDQAKKDAAAQNPLIGDGEELEKLAKALLETRVQQKLAAIFIGQAWDTAADELIKMTKKDIQTKIEELLDAAEEQAKKDGIDTFIRPSSKASDQLRSEAVDELKEKDDLYLKIVRDFVLKRGTLTYTAKAASSGKDTETLSVLIPIAIVHKVTPAVGAIQTKTATDEIKETYTISGIESFQKDKKGNFLRDENGHLKNPDDKENPDDKVQSICEADILNGVGRYANMPKVDSGGFIPRNMKETWRNRLTQPLDDYRTNTPPFRKLRKQGITIYSLKAQPFKPAVANKNFSVQSTFKAEANFNAGVDANVFHGPTSNLKSDPTPQQVSPTSSIGIKLVKDDNGENIVKMDWPYDAPNVDPRQFYECWDPDSISGEYYCLRTPYNGKKHKLVVDFAKEESKKNQVGTNQQILQQGKQILQQGKQILQQGKQILQQAQPKPGDDQFFTPMDQPDAAPFDSRQPSVKQKRAVPPGIFEPESPEF